MSNHDHEKIESLLATGLGAKGMMRIALREYAEHYAAQQKPESTAILKAAKELGRVDALQELAKFGSDQISVYEEGEGFRWNHSHYMRTISEGSTVESLLEYLDAHREVVG